MFRKTFGSVTVKLGLATMLLGFSVITSAGSMRCFFGLPMSSEAPVISAEPSTPKAESCCPTPVSPAKPIEQKCCCIDVLKKNVIEMSVATVDDFRFDFAVLPDPIPDFVQREEVVTVQQVRWPDVHGPPGLAKYPDSPRAPPVA